MSYRSRFLTVCWTLVLITLSVLLAWQIKTGIKIKASIFDLLSDQKENSVLADIAISHSTALNKQMIFFVGDPDKGTALQLADEFSVKLAESNFFERIAYILPGNVKDLQSHYFDYRYYLLDNQTRKILQRDDGILELLEGVRSFLYSPVMSASLTNLDRDPLLLFPRFLQNIPGPPGKTFLYNSRLAVKLKGYHYFLISAEMAGNPFVPVAQRETIEFVSGAISGLKGVSDNCRVLFSGVVRFAHDSASRLEREGRFIGWGSLVCVMVLLLLMFRSFRQLLLSVLSICGGIITAVSLSTLIFDELHLIALAFGASLTGICIDYSVHYFAHHRLGGPGWDAHQGLKSILPAISLGALTSFISFFALALASFPGLKQIAVFSSLGLLGAFFTVICLLPVFMKSPCLMKEPYLLRLATRVVDFWNVSDSKNYRKFIGLFFLVFVVLGLMKIKPDDDIRLLQKVSDHLISNEMAVRKLSGGFDQGKFFIITGTSPQQTLETLEDFESNLESLKERKKIDSYLSLSSFALSEKRQKENWLLLREGFKRHNAKTGEFLDSLGFSKASKDNLAESLSKEPSAFANLNDWLNKPLGRPTKNLWIGETTHGYVSLVMLKGVQEEVALKTAAEHFPGVSYVNVVTEISSMLKRFRIQASWLVELSYVFIFVILLWRYGIKKGIAVMIPPVVAAVTALAMLGYLEGSLNVFHVISLVLVLGIGIDYPIFFAETQGKKGTPMFAIMLCALTTVCSFGLMIASETPVLHSFGFILVTGIVTALICSPVTLLFSRNT